jgi:hypothetical protein
MTALLRVTTLLLATIMIAACGRPEDPARVELRARLEQEATLSNEEIGHLLDEVGRSLAGKTVRIKEGSAPRELDEAQREVVLGMLTYRAGVFDEGLRTVDGAALRVLNAPGRASNAELDATRLLLIDVNTFLPRRFEFRSGVASDEYAFDLVVSP